MSSLRTSTPMSSLNALMPNDDRAQMANYSARYQTLGPQLIWTRSTIAGCPMTGCILQMGENWDRQVYEQAAGAGGNPAGISGQALDNANVVVASASVTLYDATTDLVLDKRTSDSGGNFFVCIASTYGAFTGPQVYMRVTSGSTVGTSGSLTPT